MEPTHPEDYGALDRIKANPRSIHSRYFPEEQELVLLRGRGFPQRGWIVHGVEYPAIQTQGMANIPLLCFHDPFLAPLDGDLS